MASKRRPIHQISASKLNFRPSSNSDPKNDLRGTKPLPDPTSVGSVLLFMLQHLCKQIVFVNIKYRILTYFGAVFFLSLIVDFAPLPKTYFSRKENILNQFFAKVSWGWTLIFTFSFVVFSSLTYCCGKKDKVLKHCIRLIVATSLWFFWVSFFEYIRNTFGRCNVKDSKFQIKSLCIGKGFHWQSVDISGHTFILIYSALVMIEEVRAIVGWDGISDLIRDEEHSRIIQDDSVRTNPLRNLDSDDLYALKANFEQYHKVVRLLFVSITILIILWDVMLFFTIVYFHNMFEKLVACIVAIGSWLITYKLWFPINTVAPPLPGEGLFKYQDWKPKEVKPRYRGVSNAKVNPTFLGMPLRAPQEDKIIHKKDAEKGNHSN